MRTYYKAIESPYWKRKPGFTGCPERVSYYGAMPQPREAYELCNQPSVRITSSRGRVTYSNYFFGKVVRTMEEAEAVCAKLNAPLEIEALAS